MVLENCEMGIVLPVFRKMSVSVCLTSLLSLGLNLVIVREPVGENGINKLKKNQALFKGKSHFKFLLSVLNVLLNTLVSCGRCVDSQKAF